MDFNASGVRSGENPAVGTPMVSLHQPSSSSVYSNLMYEELKLVRLNSVAILKTLQQIERNTRRLSWWERIKSWLGMATRDM